MNSPFIAVLAISLSLWGCAFSKETPEEKTKKQATENVEATVKALAFSGELSDHNVQVEFLDDEPSIYKLRISWPKDVPAMKIGLNGLPYTIVNSGNVFITPVGHSSVTLLHLVALNSLGGENSTYSAEAKAPVDIILKKDTHYSKDTELNANRIYLLDEGNIITNGYNLTINTNKLYVETSIGKSQSRMHATEAKIRTTLPGTKAPSADFLSDSRIKINAKKAYGHLRIAMIGFDGIDGTDGITGSAGLKGQDGKPGTVEYIQDSCVAADGMPCQRARTEAICKVKPTNGFAGGVGEQGGDGADGSRGGAPGILSVMVDDDSDFSLEVAQRKGQPGVGGKGAKGGSGGLGGNAGSNQKVCPNAQPGLSGSAGKDGKDGLNGAPSLINHIETNVKDFRSYEID